MCGIQQHRLKQPICQKNKKDITGEIRKYFDTNKYKEITNLRDSAKAIIRGKFIAVRA